MNEMERKPTDEWRQVKEEIKQWIPHEFGGRYEIKGYSYRLQRKWLVQDGPLYSPVDFGPPARETDKFFRIIEGRPWWIPMKEQWEDVPIVIEEEAKQ